MQPFIFGAGVLFFLLALGLGFSVFEQVRSRLPPSLKDDLTARFAVDVFIGETWVPVRVRRQYLASMIFLSATLACFAAYALLDGRRLLALALLAVCLIGLGAAGFRWKKYRELL